MTLSEAIRLGSMLKPQAFGDYAVGDGTCAMGAANEALGLPVDDCEHIPDELGPIFNLLDTIACPECHEVPLELNVIAHLNDDHRWSREQIANQVQIWEQAIEQAQSTPIVEPVAVHAE